MKLYNTLTRQIEEIRPINPKNVTIYTCGPTVYDYPHVGNWFTFIRYDLLIRTLKTAGLDPKWVMNITDVGHLVSDGDEGEDKLEKSAKREGKTAWDIAKHYGDYFVDALEKLNITKPDFLPKATEHIKEQIELIQTLETKGYAYVIDDGVYYDTNKFEGYSAFARLDLDDLQAGARIEVNQQKHNPSDFALWKLSPKNQKRDMEWDSPWGKGFPGWHLECSAMSMKYLGETIDIHAGGIDHVPVHHTNEIAQSEAATGKRFCNYWMHANHITVNDEKISKSLGNSITLEDISKKGFVLESLRLHVFESHYRSQSKFSWESLEAAQNRLRVYQALADLKHQTKAISDEKSAKFDGDIEEIKSKLENDLNTPQALAILSAIADTTDVISNSNKADFQTFLKSLDELLGLNLSSREDVSSEIKELLHRRDGVRKNKDWNKSDEIREQLSKLSVEVRDTKYGQIWARTSVFTKR